MAEPSDVAAALAANRPALVQSLQSKLDGLVGRDSGFLDSLHTKVKARIEALETLQGQHDKAHAEYQDELRALKAKYAAQYAPLYARRAAVVSGAAEVEANAGAAPDAEAPAGVPDFWLIALRNHEAFEALVSEKDAAVLAHLQDVGCEPVVGEVDADGDPLTGFLLTFTFGANPYFSNATLTKKYLFADEDESYLVRAVGSPISWAPGKSPCVKVMKKKGKPGKGGAPPKTLTKLEPCDSFFNFFSPPKVPEDGEEADAVEDMDALQDAVEADAELGVVFRDDLVPNAVNWFTGAAIQQDDEYDEEEEEDEEGEEGDEEGEEEEEEEEEARAGV